MQDQSDEDSLRARISVLEEQKRQAESSWLRLKASTPPRTRQAVLEEIARAGVQVLQAEAAGVYVIDFETSELVFEAVIGGGGAKLLSHRMPIGQGIPGLVAATGQAHIVSADDAADHVAKSVVEMTGYRPRSVLCVPMFFESKLIGVLGFYDKLSSSGFVQSDIAVAGAFASIAAQVLGMEILRENAAGATAGTGNLPASAKLAELVSELAFKNERSALFCIRVLEAMKEYLDGQEA